MAAATSQQLGLEKRSVDSARRRADHRTRWRPAHRPDFTDERLRAGSVLDLSHLLESRDSGLNQQIAGPRACPLQRLVLRLRLAGPGLKANRCEAGAL